MQAQLLAQEHHTSNSELWDSGDKSEFNRCSQDSDSTDLSPYEICGQAEYFEKYPERQPPPPEYVVPIKRRAPETPSDIVHVIKKPRTDTTINLRVCTHDYDPFIRRLLKMAQRHYRLHISTIWAFPNSPQQINWAKDIWIKLCDKQKVTLEQSQNHLQLVSCLLHFLHH
jgi:hypothetical protein